MTSQAMRRREFLKALGFGAAALGAARWGQAAESATGAVSAAKPNIIFFLSDDYGIGGIGCYGADGFKTPNLDALAKSALRFENCFVAPLCAPTRSLCMFGRYAFRTGVTDNGAGGAATPERETCIAKVLKQAGYATAESGKWHQLKYMDTPEEARAWGFDEFLAWNGGSDRYWKPVLNKNGQTLPVVDKSYGPDLLHEFVVDFITRNRDRPFFVYYPMVLIHSPILPTPDTGPQEGAEKAAKAKGAGKGGGLMADNIAYQDKLVGKLVAELDRLGLREKTALFFVGDNGCVGGGSIGGRKIDGGKGTMKEGGSRVPLIVSWKGTTPEGKVCQDLVDGSDFFPTLAELAGAKLPEGVTIDGRSFAPQLRGQAGKPREWVYVQLGSARYVRDKRWKLTGDGQLLDMKDAPFGETPVAAGAEDVEAAAARKRLQAALDRLNPAGGKTDPGVGPNKAPKKGRKKAAVTTT